MLALAASMSASRSPADRVCAARFASCAAVRGTDLPEGSLVLAESYAALHSLSDLSLILALRLLSRLSAQDNDAKVRQTAKALHSATFGE